MEVLPSGRVRVLTGTSPHGQGHETSWAMLVADRLGVALDQIDVLHGDTDVVPRGGFTGGSRSVQIGGTNVWRAAGYVVERGRELAAHLLEADPADVVLDGATGRFHVAGTPTIAVSWRRLAEAAAAEGGSLSGQGDFVAGGGTFPCGAHLAVVEIDIETGKATLLRLVAADDAGRILNPLLAEGQVHGGVAQGIAQALFEEVVYDADGNPLTSTFADYAIVSAAELPSFETLHLETPAPGNDLGAKGIGESGSIGATPAVQNAVVDALAHLGVRHVQMPASPERVWRAIVAARGGDSGLTRSDHPGAGHRHPASAVLARFHAENLVHGDLVQLEGDDRSEDVQPPHPGPNRADEGDGLVPTGIQVVDPAPQREGIVLPQRLHVADLQVDGLHGRHHGGDVLQLPVGEHVAGREGPPVELGAVRRRDGVVEQPPARSPGPRSGPRSRRPSGPLRHARTCRSTRWRRTAPPATTCPHRGSPGAGSPPSRRARPRPPACGPGHAAARRR